MITPHPMEQIYINQLRQIAIAVMRHEADFDEYMTKLELHRERAKKMGWLRYHAAVLNMIGQAHSQIRRMPSEAILETFHEALSYAQQSGDVELQCLLLGSLSIQTLNTLYDIEVAEHYVDQTVSLFDTDEQHSSLSYLYTTCNKIRFRLWVGDFTAAAQILEQAWIQTTEINLAGNERNSYARVILLLRHEQIQVDIATGNCKAVMSAIRLNQELFEGVYGQDATNPIHEVDMALYMLICKGNEDAFTTHLQATSAARELFDVIEGLRHVEYLKHLEYIPQAHMMLDKTIAMVELPDFNAHQNENFERYTHALREELNTRLSAI